MMKFTPQTIKKVVYLLCLGLGVWLGFSFTRAQSNQNEPVSIPFSINRDEVQGGTKILASTGVYQLSEGDTVSEYLVEDRVSLIILRDDSYGDIAYDLVIGGVKEEYTFNARNSAKAAIIRTLGMFGVPLEFFAEAYDIAESHPRITELSALYLAAKHYPATDEDMDLTIEIAFDIRDQLRARHSN